MMNMVKTGNTPISLNKRSSHSSNNTPRADGIAADIPATLMKVSFQIFLSLCLAAVQVVDDRRSFVGRTTRQSCRSRFGKLIPLTSTPLLSMAKVYVSLFMQV